MVLQDPRHLTKFEKGNSSHVRISDLLPSPKGGPCTTLYLLYEIKRLQSEGDEIGTETEEEDELNDDSDDSHNSSSSSCSRKPDKKPQEEDEEEKEFVDVFTDILSLIVLNKKQKEAELAAEQASEEVLAYESEFDKMKDSQMAPLRHQPIKKASVVKETEDQQFEGSSMCESELPQFA